MTEGASARRRIGIFFKSPVAGRVKTRLCPPLTPAEAATLYAAFLADTIALCRNVAGAEITLFHAGESPTADPREGVPGAGDLPWRTQAGDDLGARMAAALEALLADGPDPVRALLVGTDHPDLPAGRIEAAFVALERSDLVLGPTSDGGYYLVGLSRPVPGLFEGIAWSTEVVYRQQVERAGTLGVTRATLPAWQDVDTPDDLVELRRRLIATASIIPENAPSTRRALNSLASLK